LARRGGGRVEGLVAPFRVLAGGRTWRPPAPPCSSRPARPSRRRRGGPARRGRLRAGAALGQARPARPAGHPPWRPRAGRRRGRHGPALAAGAAARKAWCAMVVDAVQLAYGVPDAVLNKAGPLTDEEWALMREHPAIGLRILEGVPRMDAVRAVVYSHHERWDGAGYPEGLKGSRSPSRPGCSRGRRLRRHHHRPPLPRRRQPGRGAGAAARGGRQPVRARRRGRHPPGRP
jgi:hypothetical protein